MDQLHKLGADLATTIVSTAPLFRMLNPEKYSQGDDTTKTVILEAAAADDWESMIASADSDMEVDLINCLSACSKGLLTLKSLLLLESISGSISPIHKKFLVAGLEVASEQLRTTSQKIVSIHTTAFYGGHGVN